MNKNQKLNRLGIGAGIFVVMAITACAPVLSTPLATLMPNPACSPADIEMQKTVEPNSLIPIETLVYSEPGVPGTAYCNDSGKTFNIWVTSRIGIILNAVEYPQPNMVVKCYPDGAIGAISNIPSVPPSYYAVRYEGVQTGTCTIQNGNFEITVNVVQQP